MPWTDPETAADKRAVLLLDAEGGRGLVKRLGKWLDGEGAELRPAVLIEGRRRGAELPDEAVDWPGKKLLRIARARQGESRTRINPIARDEAFVCGHCGAEVPAHGRTARDHCPHCLYSLHVDVVPGDRQSDCHGLMTPMGSESRGRFTVIRYRCVRCGAEHNNRALLDGDPPDDWGAIAALSRGTAP